MIWILYNVVFVLAFTLMLPWFLFRMVRRGGYARHFANRFGSYEPELREKLAEGGFIWMHAVSVGEFHVARLFMEGLRQRKAGVRFFVARPASNRREGHGRLGPEYFGNQK